MMLSGKESRFYKIIQPLRDSERRDQNIRCFTLQIIIIALFSILIHRLFELQIVNGQKYAEDFELQITRTVRDHNTRGNIYDCNGEALTYNELIYTVGIQPIHSMAAENNNHVTGNSIWADSPSIMGESAIVMEVSTGTILYEKNMHDTHYPASITKIMTALLAIENCEMDEVVTVPPEAVYMEDKGTHIALDEGEQLTVEQGLYAIMLASANDAAYALSLNRNYIIFAIIVGIFAAGIILKVSTEKYRSKNRLGSRWKKKNIRRKRR